MAEEAVPIVGLRLRVPGPVGLFRVDEDDPRLAVFLIGVAPDVIVAPGRLGRAPRFLKPRMLIGRMVQHQVRDHADAAPVGVVEERPHVLERAVIRIDAPVIRHVIAVVPQRRREEGEQPQAIDAQPLQIVQLLPEAAEVADAVVVAVVKRLDVQARRRPRPCTSVRRRSARRPPLVARSCLARLGQELVAGDQQAGAEAFKAPDVRIDGAELGRQVGKPERLPDPDGKIALCPMEPESALRTYGSRSR
ncbi:MAG: hypothetical protein KatS3mg082_0456 [Nitrospiraceae bacterium]|nr:MAG: hypothetical protein KatS3mg082_0456 [Nitrospiraceae bacterium]